jgi:hypothetical protein
MKNTIKPFYIENETVYQVTVRIEDKPVIVDITYSASENGSLEFEYAQVSEENGFDEYRVNELNKILECGVEENIVRYLETYYEVNNINFDPNEYSK